MEWNFQNIRSILLTLVGGVLIACGGGSENQNRPAASDLNAPQADFYNWIGNTTLIVPERIGVLANDPVDATVRSFDSITTSGGTVNLNADGSFVYSPAIGFFGTDSFEYAVSDVTEFATVSIQIDTLSWYVSNSVSAGNGSLSSPFNTLEAAQNASSAGDTIYVFRGDGTSTGHSTGVTLKDNQKLIGQGVDFGYIVIPETVLNIVRAGTSPIVRSTGGLDGVVRLSNNNEVAGLTIEGTTGIQHAGIFGSGIDGFNIHHNTIVRPVREGIFIFDVSGRGVISDNAISNNLTADGIHLSVDRFSLPETVDLTLERNTLSDIADDGIQINFPFDSKGASVLDMNQIYNVGLGSGDGSGVSLTQDNSRVDFTLTHNTISDFMLAGIEVLVGGISGGNTTIIESNVISNTTAIGSRSGIVVQAGSRSSVTSTISFNNITNCGRIGIESIAISLADHHTQIQSNLVDSVGGEDLEGGINLSARVFGRVFAFVMDNTLTNNQAFGMKIISGGVGSDSSSLCLMALSNISDAGFQFINSPSDGAVLKIEAADQNDFESTNIGGSNFVPNIGAIDFMPTGTCGF